MKLKKDYLGISFYLNSKIKKLVIDQLMDPSRLMPEWGPKELDMRLKSLEWVLSNDKHRLYYLTQKVQDYSDKIKFEKINLGWFRQLKHKCATFIINKEEFFRYYIEEGKAIYILHYYKVQFGITPEDIEIEKMLNPTISGIEEFMGYNYDTWVIRFDQEEHPDGFMPENEYLGQKFEHKIRFIKYLLFVELSGVMTMVVDDNQKVKLDGNWDKNLDGKVKNESGVPVILVGTSWNKTIIRTTGFSVEPHIRIQPFGPGRSLYRPVWIEEYEKKGYVRKAPKISDPSSNSSNEAML